MACQMLTRELKFLWQLEPCQLFEHENCFYVVVEPAKLELDTMKVRCVARRHYLQIRDKHFDKAIGQAQQQAPQVVGKAMQGEEQKCENPGDFDNRRDSVVKKWARQNSNLRPLACQASALTN